MATWESAGLGGRVLFSTNIDCDQRRWGVEVMRWWWWWVGWGKLIPPALAARPKRAGETPSKANHDVKVGCLRAAERPTWTKSHWETCLGPARFLSEPYFLLGSLAAPFLPTIPMLCPANPDAMPSPTRSRSVLLTHTCSHAHRWMNFLDGWPFSSCEIPTFSSATPLCFHFRLGTSFRAWTGVLIP